MENISMILMTCDKYEDTWYPFVTQLKSNWSEFNMPIYIGTETKKFSYQGFDIRCPLANGPVYNQWSNRLLKLLQHIDSDYILFFLDDFWLSEKVDNIRFENALSCLKSNSDIGFICLLHEEKYYLKPEQRINIVESEFEEFNEWKKGLPFRITTQAGIWKKKYLMKILRSHESAWYFETRATWRSKYYKERVLNAKKSIFNYPIGGVIGGGKLYRDYLHLYPEDITSRCTHRGIINFGDIRQYPGIMNKGLKYYISIIKSAMPKW